MTGDAFDDVTSSIIRSPKKQTESISKGSDYEKRTYTVEDEQVTVELRKVQSKTRETKIIV